VLELHMVACTTMPDSVHVLPTFIYTFPPFYDTVPEVGWCAFYVQSQVHPPFWLSTGNFVLPHREWKICACCTSDHCSELQSFMLCHERAEPHQMLQSLCMMGLSWCGEGCFVMTPLPPNYCLQFSSPSMRLNSTSLWCRTPHPHHLLLPPGATEIALQTPLWLDLWKGFISAWPSSTKRRRKKILFFYRPS
jgi:hypothetical protein